MSARVERRIRNRLRRISQRKRQGWEGLLGDGSGNVEVPGQPDYCYVRPRGSDLPAVVRRGDAPNTEGLHVWVGPDPYQRDRVRIMGVIGDSGSDVDPVEAHADTHYLNGTDPVYILDRQITSLLCYASSGMAVHVNGGYIVHHGQAFHVDSDDLDLTSSIPGSGAAYSLIRVNTSGTISVQDGVAVDSLGDLSDADIPLCADGYVALAFVRLYEGQTSLSKTTSNPDVKPLIWGGGLWDLSGANADQINVDTANFDGLLSAADDDVQAALDTLDDHSHAVSIKPLYLMTCHKSADELMYVLGSVDGITWNLVKRRNAFTPASGNQRDPSLLYHNGFYWAAHTNSTNTYFTVLKSADLTNWEKVADVDMSDITDLYYVWAPEWFVDPDDSAVHVFVSCSTDSATDNFQIYEVHPTDADMETWSSPVAITITDVDNAIDPFMVYKDGTYYLWYKEEDDDYIQYASSSTLTGTYTNVEVDDWASWGTPREAPCLVQIDADTWRIYMNEHSGLDSVAVYYSESTDDWATWSAAVEITAPWIVAHPTVITVLDNESLFAAFGSKLSDSREQDSWITRSTTQTISNTTGTAVQFSAAVRDALGAWDSGSNTKLTAPFSGVFHIGGHVKWADTSGGKRVFDIRVNGSTYLGTQSTEATAGHPGPDQSTSVPYFLDKDDYIEMVVWQNQGGNVDISAAQMFMASIG